MRTLTREFGAKAAIRYRLAQIFKLESLTLKIHGRHVHVRLNTPDIRVAQESLGAEFDPLDGLLNKSFDGLIIDAGAYIGTSAIRFSEMYPQATILCIEPSDLNYKILCKNIDGRKNIESIKAALTTVAGEEISLHDRGTGEWGFSILREEGRGSCNDVMNSVQSTSVGEISSRFPGREIGILKLDIEGAEKAIFLESSPDFLNIPIIFVETHDRIIPGCMEALEKFSDNRILKNFGGEKWLSMDMRLGSFP